MEVPGFLQIERTVENVIELVRVRPNDVRQRELREFGGSM
jgi:hypothetical protein